MAERVRIVKKSEIFHWFMVVFTQLYRTRAYIGDAYRLLHFVATRIGEAVQLALPFNCGQLPSTNNSDIEAPPERGKTMNVKAKLILSALGICALPLAQAGDFEDFGRVVRVQPRIEQIRTPRQECRTEYVQAQVQPQRSQGGSVVGGIAGALLGSQVGSGNGKVAAAAAGAIAGAMVGDHVENDGRNYAPQTQEQAVRQCRTVDAVEQRTNGYDVTYDYRGHTYNTVTSRDPGNRIRLRVSVEADQQ
jgi:uncharacterized protein YcfJ